jgi:hypothetical protein
MPIEIDMSKKIKADMINVNYNRIVDNAVQDATSVLLIPNTSKSLENIAEGNKGNFKETPLNLDKALSRFYQTMYINMHIENDTIAQTILKQYIPIKIAVGYDGYYINTLTEVKDSTTGNVKLQEVWRDKKNYTLYDNKNKIGINFTLDDNVTVYNSTTKTVTQGTKAYFATIYPNSIFNNEFDNIRKKTISDQISQDLSYFTQQNNDIAKREGWNYQFNVPYFDERAIDSISFIAFVQGLPMQGTENKFNSYGFGIAQITKSKKYYGVIQNGKKIYHEEGCSDISGTPIIFNSKIEAVKQGFYPDPKCSP